MEWHECEIKGQGLVPLNLHQSFPQGSLKAHLFLLLFFPKKMTSPLEVPAARIST